MKKYLVVDTETTGLFDFRQPADANGQPRMAQFAGLMVDNIDAEPKFCYSAYVKPDGWSMSPDTGKVNGLSDEFLMAKGVPVSDTLDFYTKAINDGYIVVAFNSQFDTKVLRAELRRAGRDDLFDRTPNICVMRACTDIVKIPRKTGNGFKFPKLGEACDHFGIVNSGAHDAYGDAYAAFAVMLKLHAFGALPEPAVHYAKEAA